jgi:hypothetical protein
MYLKTLQYVILLLLLPVPILAQGAQDNPNNAARLFRRYELGAALNRINEDLFSLSVSIEAKERPRVAVRVCSKESLPFALAIANANPFYAAESLTDGYGYRSDQVIFLRSEDCLSAKDPVIAVTEIWTIREGASLPSYVEALKSSEVKVFSLGKKPAFRGVRDYRSAVSELIKNLRDNPTSKGFVFGYRLNRRLGAILQRRLREVAKTLKESGLPADRYLVGPMTFNDEFSLDDPKPQYPSVFIIEVGAPR